MKDFIYYFVLLIELLIVAYLDLKTKKIKNFWSVLNFVLVPLFFFVFSESFFFNAHYMMLPGGFLAVGFSLYYFGIMGAGDVKFLSTFMLLVAVPWRADFVDGLLSGTVLFSLFELYQKSKKSQLSLSFRLFTLTFEDLLGGKYSFAPVFVWAWCWVGLRFLWNVWI